LNYTDNRGYDYPLIRIKYAVLLLITPLVTLEFALQALYFLNVNPNVITSCCGTLFSADAEGVTSGIVALPNLPVEVLYYGAAVVTLLLGIRVIRSGRGLLLFGGASVVLFLAAVMALIGFASLYFYELPTHHCPFCLLQKHVHFVGYPLYLAFLVGVVGGLGGVVILPFRRRRSLQASYPGIVRGLASISVVCTAIGLTIVLIGVMASKLSLHG
jgi:hypothetical protein